MTRLITLVEPDGSTIDATLVSAGTRAGLPSATFDLDAKTWEHVEASGLLHADPARKRSGARPFDPRKTVQIEAVLDPVAAIDGTDALADRLGRAAAGDPLLSTEAWWTLSATQEVDLPGELADTGSLQEGISFEHPSWLRDAAGSVGLEEAWQRAMELGELFDASTSTPLYDLVAAVLVDQGWDVDRPSEDATVLHASVASEHGEFELYVRTDEDVNHVTAFAVLPVEIDASELPALYDIAARLNQTVHVGSYEVDPDEVVLSFKNGIDVTGDRLSVPLLRSLVGTALVAGERALPQVLALASD